MLEFSRGRAHLIAVRATQRQRAGQSHHWRISRPVSLRPRCAWWRCTGRTPKCRWRPIPACCAGDEVFVLADKQKIRDVLRAIHNIDQPVRRVMIAGGGKVGLRLARSLVGQCQVKLIEQRPQTLRITWPASCPCDMLVLEGDCRRRRPAARRERGARWTCSSR